jgi:hypothetical protein
MDWITILTIFFCLLLSKCQFKIDRLNLLPQNYLRQML